MRFTCSCRGLWLQSRHWLPRLPVLHARALSCAARASVVAPRIHCGGEIVLLLEGTLMPAFNSRWKRQRSSFCSRLVVHVRHVSLKTLTRRQQRRNEAPPVVMKQGQICGMLSHLLNEGHKERMFRGTSWKFLWITRNAHRGVTTSSVVCDVRDGMSMFNGKEEGSRVFRAYKIHI